MREELVGDRWEEGNRTGKEWMKDGEGQRLDIAESQGRWQMTDSVDLTSPPLTGHVTQHGGPSWVLNRVHVFSL